VKKRAPARHFHSTWPAVEQLALKSSLNAGAVAIERADLLVDGARLGVDRQRSPRRIAGQRALGVEAERVHRLRDRQRLGRRRRAEDGVHAHAEARVLGEQPQLAAQRLERLLADRVGREVVEAELRAYSRRR
jgi:hypothetical protein